jgi:gliding motility-associated-like protein
VKFWLKYATVVLLFVLSRHAATAQLSGTGCIGQTSYTDGQPNDPIYYYPAGQLGELTVVPEVAGASFNFVWSRFVPGNSNWNAFTTQNNQASSTITGLQPGAYFVSVRNSSNVIVGCYRAWIAQVLQEPQVDVQPIPSNCVGPISLVGSFTPGQITPISNLPESQLVIDANTQISVCFTGTHTWVSDLAFYLRGPATCGNPNLLLMPNPFGSCNSTDNFSNFCFSTESTNNINVCSGIVGLSGTYGSYGTTSTPINWSGIYGCDAMNGGWAVQVYDCVGLDVGFLTDATITFTGFDLCGASQTVTYTTPNNFSSAINDNSCSSVSASIFTVSPAISPANLNCTFGYEWTSDPPVNIPNATSSLNIDITSLTDLAGNPIPWQDIDFTLSSIVNCDELAADNDCFGGNGSDTETYTHIPQTPTAITDVSALCINDGIIQLTADFPGGTWSGLGIVDAALGTFDPMMAGEGSFTIDYTFSDPCILPDNTQIVVEVEPDLALNLQDDVCENAVPFSLVTSPTDGIFSGNGIVDALLGTFDPAIAGEGMHTISMISNTVCPINLTDVIIVHPIPTLNITPNSDVCPGEDFQLVASGADSYVWSPSLDLSADNVANPIASLTSTTTYSVLGSSSFGCEAQGDVTLTLLDSPSISVAQPVLTCPGASFTLTAEGSTGVWEWTLPGGASLGVGSSIDLAFDATTTVQVEVIDNCSNSAITEVIVPIESLPTIDAGANAVVCTGASTQLQADISGSYVSVDWTTLDGAIIGSVNSPEAETSTEGTYEVSIQTALGCLYSDDVFVDVVPLPSVDAGDNTEVCGGQPFQLQASGALNYLWSPATGLSSTSGASVNTTLNAPITYTVTGTDGNGCVNSDQISLSIIPQPSLNAESVAMICPGEDVLLSALGSEGVYSWSPNTALNTASGSEVIASPMVTTQYTVTLTDVCGVELQAQVNVPVEPIYSASAGPDTGFCEGEQIVVNGNVTGPAPAISWYNGSSLLAGENTASIVVTTPGTYAIQVESPLGCIYDDAVIVNEINYPTFYLADTLSFCQGSSAALSIAGNWDFIQWSNGTQASAIDVTQEGDYYVTVTDDGCTTNDTVNVYRVDLPVIELGADVTICQGQTTVLSAGFNGQWSTGASADSIVVASAGTYAFEYSLDGCFLEDEVNVQVNPLPFIDAVTTQYGCIDQTYTIVVNDFATGAYEWSDGSESPYLTVDAPGEYWFMVTNECGTKAETITVILEDCEETVYAPTCFTPDNDGVNDVWKVITRNIISMKTLVFNRWGEVVFESEELSPVWTGGFDSGDTFVADGMYFYRIEFEQLEGKKELREGSMFIIR